MFYVVIVILKMKSVGKGSFWVGVLIWKIENGDVCSLLLVVMYGGGFVNNLGEKKLCSGCLCGFDGFLMCIGNGLYIVVIW